MRDGNAVGDDVAVHVDGLGASLDGGKFLGVDDGVHMSRLSAAAQSARQDVSLLLLGEVADAQAHHEAVKLRLGQGVGAFELHGV